ncbi:hypothetical protein, partial [Paenibacillus xylanexedens]|uniref:hypothetical protein n=1 Tax=Paenibacillus xylanexedens TaxID=528191 RepID=UPI001C8D7E3F
MRHALGVPDQEQQGSGGGGIDSEEAERSPLSPDFPLIRGIHKNLGITAIIRTIRHRNAHHATPSTQSNVKKGATPTGNSAFRLS